MTEQNVESPLESILERLTQEARSRWGEDYPAANAALLEQAARHIANVAAELPDTETEPGFYQ